MICCTICGMGYRAPGRDTLDICPPCFTENFAGAQPPLDVRATPDPSVQALTPRQHQALQRAAARWAQEDVP